MPLNKVMLIGNVGKDPEIRYLEGDSKVATIRMATSEKYRDRDGRQKEYTEWHTVTAWRATADLVEKYVRKGSLLYVEGRLRTRSWTDKTGVQKSATEIVADNIQFLGRQPQSGAENSTSAPTAPKTPPTMPEIDTVDDDLPF